MAETFFTGLQIATFTLCSYTVTCREEKEVGGGREKMKKKEKNRRRERKREKARACSFMKMKRHVPFHKEISLIGLGSHIHLTTIISIKALVLNIVT